MIQKHSTAGGRYAAVMALRRRIRAWKILCWLVIVLSIAGWARTLVAIDTICYRTGRLLAPEAMPKPSDPAWWTFRVRDWGVVTPSGSVAISLSSYDSLDPEPAELIRQWRDSLGLTVRSSPSSKYQGFEWFHWAWPDRVAVLGLCIADASRQGVRARVLAVPLWLIAAIAASPLVLSWRRQRRLRRRLSQGLCTHCGYHRAGLAPGQPCPECGRARDGSLDPPALHA